MTEQELASMIWDVKETIRDTYSDAEVEDVILPFTLLRRMDYLNWLILGIGEKFIQSVNLKTGTNDEIVSVTQEIVSNNKNFTIKSYNKSSNIMTENPENNTDIISIIINLAEKLSENPNELKKLKDLYKNLNN